MPEIKEYKNKINLVYYFSGLGISMLSYSLLCLVIFSIEYFSYDYFLYLSLVDAFTITGCIGILFYLLTLVAEAGAFDMLVYAVKLVFYTTFFRNLRDTKLPKNYAEYKELKRGKKKLSVSFMLIAALIFFVIGLFLLIPYYQLRP